MDPTSFQTRLPPINSVRISTLSVPPSKLSPHLRFSLHPLVREVLMNVHKGALLDCLIAKDEEMYCRPKWELHLTAPAILYPALRSINLSTVDYSWIKTAWLGPKARHFLEYDVRKITLHGAFKQHALSTIHCAKIIWCGYIFRSHLRFLNFAKDGVG